MKDAKIEESSCETSSLVPQTPINSQHPNPSHNKRSNTLQ
jgi:hypothetical protein